MKAIKYITEVVYGMIIGNWLINCFHQLTFKPSDNEKRFVVLALIDDRQIKMLSTNSRENANYIETLINETDFTTSDVYDLMIPDDKEDLGYQNLLDYVPDDCEDYDQLVNIMEIASKLN